VQIRGFHILENGEPGWEWAYYSHEQFATILATFPPRGGDKFDRMAFGRALHAAMTAFLLEVDCEHDPENLAPSEIERTCHQVAAQAERLFGSLKRVEGALARTAKDLALKGDPPPGCQGERLDATDRDGEEVAPITSWPVEKALRRFQETLAWLPHCATAAAQQAEQEKTDPGNRSADSMDDLVVRLSTLFCESSAGPATAYRYSHTGEARGTLIDFLEACLRPLGCEDDRMSFLRRVKKAEHEGRITLRDLQD
jgi:hypothetical protein